MVVSFESSFKRSLHLRNAGFTTVRKSFHCEGYSPFFFFLNGGASGLDSDWFLGGCGKWGLTLQNYLELDFNTSIGAAKPKIYTSIRYNTLKAAY